VHEEGCVTDVVVKRWWWPAATVGTASAIGALLVVAEGATGLGAIAGSQYVSFLAAHLTAAVAIAAILSARLAWRGMTTYVNRSNPLWEGVWYGLLVTAAGSALFVVFEGLRSGGTAAAMGWGDLGTAVLWSVALPMLTFELVVASLAGGVMWMILSGRGRQRP
jgi:hypothetical protein